MLKLVGIAIRESGEVTKRSLRETPNTKETENIALSNKYGSLEMTTNVDGSKDMVTGEENKENQDMNIQNMKGKGFSQVKEGLIFSGKASAPTSSKGVNKEKWATNRKLTEGSRGKPREKTIGSFEGWCLVRRREKSAYRNLEKD